MIVVEEARDEHVPALRALFEAAHAPCFCRYWSFEGTKNEWLDRCATRPEENAGELPRTVDEGGLIAFEREDRARAIGWMKLTARSRMQKLVRLGPYRSLALDDDGVLSVGCFLVDPAFRRRGVARALIAAAGPIARKNGARAIEAYPRRSSETLYDEEVYQGPEGLFREAGYEAIHGVPPYPVYRKVL